MHATPAIALGMPGTPEVLLIILIILLLFGAKKLPELSRSLGKSLSAFKKGQQEGYTPEDDKDEEKKEVEPPEDSDFQDKDKGFH